MAYGKALSRRKSKKVFAKGKRSDRKNVALAPARGGHRL